MDKLLPLTAINFTSGGNPSRWGSHSRVTQNQELVLEDIKRLQTRCLRIVFNNNVISTKKSLLEIVRAYHWTSRTTIHIQYNRTWPKAEKGLLINAYTSYAAFERSLRS